MKIAPSVKTLSAGFPNKNHQIDSIIGTPERLGLNIFFEAITQNAASIKTLKKEVDDMGIWHWPCQHHNMQRFNTASHL